MEKISVKQIQAQLFELEDTKYRDFQVKLIPTVKPDSMIGVRTPLLKTLAKKLFKENDTSKFLSTLPHKYFDENQLHAFIINEQKDFSVCMKLLEKFLPYIDNWATCDQLSPKIFKKNKNELLPYIEKWLYSEKTFTVRFAVGMLMQHFLDEDFKIQYMKKVAAIRSQEYYINMMVAWYFATALAKQYDAALGFIKENKLEEWTHNKAIQKAIESYRITAEQKDYLRTLKR